jgi:hypothetical protein
LMLVIGSRDVRQVIFLQNFLGVGVLSCVKSRNNSVSEAGSR